MKRNHSRSIGRGAAGVLVLAAGAAWAQAPAPAKPPIAQYWMDVATGNMSIPGMRGAGGGGLLGGLMGGMGGMGGGPGGAAGFGGTGKTLDLGLYTRNKPQGADGRHGTPPPARFDAPLPLVPPRPVASEPGRPVDREPGEPVEKPRARMLMYWGCGETVRAGQPRVIDTATMSPAEFGKALSSRGAPDRGAARAAGRSVWPNPTDPRRVPQDASLVGAHQVSGEGVPDIRFTLGANQDFMAPLDITLTGAPSASVGVEWRPVPTARAFFAQAMGSKGGAETIIWTSSESAETGFGLFDYLPNNLVDRWVGERVLMPASTLKCAIPAGIFEGVQGAMVRMIAYGQELNLVHPPRPDDPKVPWEPIWAARVREKSTGMAMVGMSDGRGGASDDAPRGRGAQEASGGSATQGEAPAQGEAPSQDRGGGGILPGGVNPVDVLRGIFRR